MPHTCSCADEIIERLAGDDVHTLAQEIVHCCGHHPLKAYRLASRWTVPAAVQALTDTARQAGLPERGTDDRTWRRWESGGWPDRDYQDRLARLFTANSVLLGFVSDYSPGGDHTDRRSAMRLAAGLALAPAFLWRPPGQARTSRTGLGGGRQQRRIA